jgi:hypothetical protein
MLHRIQDGRTDLVFDYLSQGHAATSADEQGTRLIVWCAYDGDVSAIRYLLANGESLTSLGENLDLNGAVFHGHRSLCQFLVEHGANVSGSCATARSRSTRTISPLTTTARAGEDRSASIGRPHVDRRLEAGGWGLDHADTRARTA